MPEDYVSDSETHDRLDNIETQLKNLNETQKNILACLEKMLNELEHRNTL